MASDSLTIATGLTYTKESLRKLNNITYLFNPNWIPQGEARAGVNTLPMSIFHIIDMKEILTSQMSAQQMILYKDKSTASDLLIANLASSSADKSQLEVVADNIVNQPKQYQIEALLPMKYDSLMNSSLNDGGYDPMIILALLKAEDYKAVDWDDYSSFSNGIHTLTASTGTVFQVALGWTNTVFSILKTVISKLTNLVTSPIGDIFGGSGSSVGDYVSTILNGTSYNKDSLEAMWLSRGILKFKVPNSWRYKTVVITSCNISKNGIEDGCYRMSLTLQEVPIMTAGYYHTFLVKDSNNKLTQFLGKTLASELNKLDSGS